MQHLVLEGFLFLEFSNKYKWLRLLNLCCNKQLSIEKYSNATNAFQQKKMQSDIELILNLTKLLIWEE